LVFLSSEVEAWFSINNQTKQLSFPDPNHSTPKRLKEASVESISDLRQDMENDISDITNADIYHSQHDISDALTVNIDMAKLQDALHIIKLDIHNQAGDMAEIKIMINSIVSSQLQSTNTKNRRGNTKKVGGNKCDSTSRCTT
jgi:hypothetical protein